MCGLTAYVGENAPSLVHLKLLGTINTTRGRDSCGIIYNNNTDYGIDTHYYGYGSYSDGKNGDFCQHLKEIRFKELAGEKRENNVAMIHTRKGTFGPSNKMNAHPFVLDNRFVFMHNGTIKNDNEMKKLYAPNCNSMLDSRIMAQAFWNDWDSKDFKFLLEYTGTAAFIMYDMEEPDTLYIWNGASPADKKGYYVVERGLYYVHYNKGMYIASEEETLETTFEGHKAEEFAVNTFIKVHKGEIVESTYFERTEHQRKLRDEKKQKATQSSNTKSSVSALTAQILGVTTAKETGVAQNKNLYPTDLDFHFKTKVNFVFGRYKINGENLNGHYMIDIEGNAFKLSSKFINKFVVTNTWRAFTFADGYMIDPEMNIKIFKKGLSSTDRKFEFLEESLMERSLIIYNSKLFIKKNGRLEVIHHNLTAYSPLFTIVDGEFRYGVRNEKTEAKWLSKKDYTISNRVSFTHLDSMLSEEDDFKFVRRTNYTLEVTNGKENLIYHLEDIANDNFTDNSEFLNVNEGKQKSDVTFEEAMQSEFTNLDFLDVETQKKFLRTAYDSLIESADDLEMMCSSFSNLFYNTELGTAIYEELDVDELSIIQHIYDFVQEYSIET